MPNLSRRGGASRRSLIPDSKHFSLLIAYSRSPVDEENVRQRTTGGKVCSKFQITNETAACMHIFIYFIYCEHVTIDQMLLIVRSIGD